MTQPDILNSTLTGDLTGQPIQRTLIITRGPAAGAVRVSLLSALGQQSVLAHAIAVLDGDAPGEELSRAIHDRLASVSRVGGRADLAAAGYALARVQELALVIVVDIAGTEADGAGTLIDEVASIARDGWGLDTHATCIVLADDWSAPAAREGLKALAAAVARRATVIPLNRVNNQGFELDNAEAYTAAAAAIVLALVATPLGDALSSPGDELRLGRAASLTAVGLACWRWEPEASRDQLAAAWRNRVLGQWLGVADPAQATLAEQRAAGWFEARGLRPGAMAALLEQSVVPYEVPAWPVPTPWAVAAAIDRLRALSAAMAGGRGGAVELLVDEWDEWAGEQETALRAEVAARLDREPLAGLDLAGCCLKQLAGLVYDAGDTVAQRQDQLAEVAHGVEEAVRTLLAEIDTLLRRPPAGSPVAWLPLLLRPWRWPSLVWDQWRLHEAGRQLTAWVAQQAVIEREQVVAAAAAALYQRLDTAVGRVSAHLEEVGAMCASARTDDPRPAAPLPVERLGPPEPPELEAAEAAAAIGGLGQLARQLDEAAIVALEELGRRRFQFVTELSAVAALERLLPERTAATRWWAALWVEAAPLWLCDETDQPEDSRGAERSWTAVCAAEIERLAALPAAAEWADWRGLPSVDRRQLAVMRWRTGVVP